MTPTMHKVLRYGTTIIEQAILPIAISIKSYCYCYQKKQPKPETNISVFIGRIMRGSLREKTVIEIF